MHSLAGGPRCRSSHATGGSASPRSIYPFVFPPIETGRHRDRLGAHARSPLAGDRRRKFAIIRDGDDLMPPPLPPPPLANESKALIVQEFSGGASWRACEIAASDARTPLPVSGICTDTCRFRDTDSNCACMYGHDNFVEVVFVLVTVTPPSSRATC